MRWLLVMDRLPAIRRLVIYEYVDGIRHTQEGNEAERGSLGTVAGVTQVRNHDPTNPIAMQVNQNLPVA